MNPTIPFPFYSFVPDEDAAKLNQDFDALVAFMTTEVPHRHHLQVGIKNLPSVAASSSANVTGFSWPTPFPTGVVPVVFAQQNEVGAGPSAGVVALNVYPYNISNTGCDVRLFNTTATATTAVTNGLVVFAFDYTFDVSQ